ncbi:MAG TPA: hypothetical protein PKU83_01350, partial [Chryseolinea sp.]|nr:hypothetical protein [Chryseolinea sp.]
MKKLLHLTIAALVLMSSLGIGSLSAQTKPIDKVELEKKIDSLFKDFNNTSSPGYAITVIQNGKVITKKDYGLASLEHKVSFTHNTVVTIP